MSDVSPSVMTLEEPLPIEEPMLLKSLPDLNGLSEECPRRARVQIDLMLLAIEALDLGGSEAILALTRELEIQDVIPNRVMLWRIRCTNPLRRNASRRSLTILEAKALVIVACYLAKRLTVSIRQLLLAEQQLSAKQLSFDHHFRLSDYLERFRAHYRARMNPKRPIVEANLASDDRLNELALHLLNQLLLCTGTSGMQRFWVSLFDGEVP
jgi:Protein of unknown function (DUF3038)